MFASVGLRLNGKNLEVIRNCSRQICRIPVIKGAGDSRRDVVRKKGSAAIVSLLNPDSNRNLSLSTKLAPRETPKKKKIFFSKYDVDEFMSVFPDLVKDLTQEHEHAEIPEVNARFEEVIRYVVPIGKLHRGLTTVTSYKMLEKQENLTPENIKRANIMGWIMEFWQNFLLVIDDMLDRSETRRGVPCWYKRKDIGLFAINDACLLEQGLYVLLKKYFSNHPNYVPLMELYHDATLRLAIGQTFDCMPMKNGKPNLDFFTMDKFCALDKYKCVMLYYLPVVSAMHLANVYNTRTHKEAENILMRIGTLFQIQNDFLDCYGDPELTGKVGTDIQEGKLTWLSVMALQRATPSQKKVFEKYYGSSEPGSVDVIRNLFEEMKLPDLYALCKEESLNVLHAEIPKISAELSHDVFYKIIERF